MRFEVKRRRWVDTTCRADAIYKSAAVPSDLWRVRRQSFPSRTDTIQNPAPQQLGTCYDSLVLTSEPVMTRPIQAGPSSPAQPMMRAPTCTSWLSTTEMAT